MAREPASIRYKNPGAMWGNALARKWGASPNAVVLNDGTGQGNNIAVFPTYVQGICAQLDLWRTSKHYRNKPFKDAIRIWSGGNHVESYIKFVCDRVPGMTRDTIMDDAFWRSPMGVGFLKAQAWHEAGKRYPAPDADWIEAQRLVMGGVPAIVPVPSKPVPAPIPKTATTTAVVVTGTVAGTAGGIAHAANQGISAMEICLWIGGLSALAIGAFIIGYHIIKGHWPWTGNQSQELSPLSLPQSEKSLELASVQLGLSSADLQETRSPQPSVSKPPRKRSAKPSRKTRTQRTSSAISKKRAVKKSSLKRKSKSRN